MHSITVVQNRICHQQTQTPLYIRTVSVFLLSDSVIDCLYSYWSKSVFFVIWTELETVHFYMLPSHLCLPHDSYRIRFLQKAYVIAKNF